MTAELTSQLLRPRFAFSVLSLLLVATLGASKAQAQEDYLEVLVGTDPSDAISAIPTAEIARRLSVVVGKPVRVLMAPNLKDALRASRTNENEVLIAPAHVAASGISHGYRLLAFSGNAGTFALVTRPDISEPAQLRGKRLYLPQQDSLRSYVARGVLDQTKLSLKDFAKVEFRNTSGAGLVALSLKVTDATIAASGEAQDWLKANPGKGRILLTSRQVPAGLAILSQKSLPADLQAKVARWAVSSEAAMPGLPPFVAANAEGNEALLYLASLGIHTPASLAGVTRVSAEEVAKLMLQADKPVLVDTRSAKEYANETLPGAILASYGEKSLKERDYNPQLDDLSAIQKLDKTKPTVFFCNGPECWKSYKAAEQAQKMGFTKVFWLRGGLPEWRAKGFEARKQG